MVERPEPKRRFPAEHLRRSEVLALLGETSDNTPVQRRNRALIVTLWRTGLRVSEATALRAIDVDTDAQTIRVLHGKGDKARTVGIDRATCIVLDEWMTTRVDEWNPPRGAPLFCTKNGGELWTSYIRDMLKRLARQAGIERRVHPHAFRHTFAVEMARAGMPAPLLQRLLGHSNLGTTTTYLASLSPEEAIEIIRKRDDWEGFAL
jgi:site-specific recombinase XerD